MAWVAAIPEILGVLGEAGAASGAAASGAAAGAAEGIGAAEGASAAAGAEGIAPAAEAAPGANQVSGMMKNLGGQFGGGGGSPLKDIGGLAKWAITGNYQWKPDNDGPTPSDPEYTS